MCDLGIQDRLTVPDTVLGHDSHQDMQGIISPPQRLNHDSNPNIQGQELAENIDQHGQTRLDDCAIVLAGVPQPLCSIDTVTMDTETPRLRPRKRRHSPSPESSWLLGQILADGEESLHALEPLTTQQEPIEELKVKETPPVIVPLSISMTRTRRNGEGSSSSTWMDTQKEQSIESSSSYSRTSTPPVEGSVTSVPKPSASGILIFHHPLSTNYKLQQKLDDKSGHKCDQCRNMYPITCSHCAKFPLLVQEGRFSHDHGERRIFNTSSGQFYGLIRPNINLAEGGLVPIDNNPILDSSLSGARHKPHIPNVNGDLITEIFDKSLRGRTRFVSQRQRGIAYASQHDPPEHCNEMLDTINNTRHRRIPSLEATGVLTRSSIIPLETTNLHTTLSLSGPETSIDSENDNTTTLTRVSSRQVVQLDGYSEDNIEIIEGIDPELQGSPTSTAYDHNQPESELGSDDITLIDGLRPNRLMRALSSIGPFGEMLHRTARRNSSPAFLPTDQVSTEKTQHTMTVDSEVVEPNDNNMRTTSMTQESVSAMLSHASSNNSLSNSGAANIINPRQHSTIPQSDSISETSASDTAEKSQQLSRCDTSRAGSRQRSVTQLTLTAMTAHVDITSAETLPPTRIDTEPRTPWTDDEPEIEHVEEINNDGASGFAPGFIQDEKQGGAMELPRSPIRTSYVNSSSIIVPAATSTPVLEPVGEEVEDVRDAEAASMPTLAMYVISRPTEPLESSQLDSLETFEDTPTTDISEVAALTDNAVQSSCEDTSGKVEVSEEVPVEDEAESVESDNTQDRQPAEKEGGSTQNQVPEMTSGSSKDNINEAPIAPERPSGGFVVADGAPVDDPIIDPEDEDMNSVDDEDAVLMAPLAKVKTRSSEYSDVE